MHTVASSMTDASTCSYCSTVLGLGILVLGKSVIRAFREVIAHFDRLKGKRYARSL